MPEPVERRDRLGEPRHALGLAGHVGDGQRQALAVERAAVGAQRRAELVGDVGDHAVVRGGGGAEHGHVGGQRLEHAHDAPVVRTEVVAPVADAVRLVDHQQADRARDDAEHLVAEALVREPLGRDQQQVDLVVGQALHDRLELVGVRRVDRLGAHADARGHLDLVAHQREQGRHEQRGAGALLAQQLRRDEVDGATCPTRCAGPAGRGLGRGRRPRSPRAARAGRRRRARASRGGGRSQSRGRSTLCAPLVIAIKVLNSSWRRAGARQLWRPKS